jgi:hypothetical protein
MMKGQILDNILFFVKVTPIRKIIIFTTEIQDAVIL